MGNGKIDINTAITVIWYGAAALLSTLSYKLRCLSQVIFLFLAYLCLESNKHTKSKLSLFKFFPYFPDAYVNLFCPFILQIKNACVSFTEYLTKNNHQDGSLR